MESVREERGCPSTSKETVGGRKSTRKRKILSHADKDADPAPQPKIKRTKHKTGQPFCCDICSSRYVVNPALRKPGQKSKGKATPRHVRDPETQKLLTLCNACGLQMERKMKAIPRDPPPSAEDKQRYYESAEHFAASLVEGLGEADAEKLTCPVYNTKPCGCIQKFIIGEGDREKSKERALYLLDILKQAKGLREKKFYNREEVLSKGKGQRKVGLGNGHRKSKEYEDYVLSNRKTLRGDLRMCERATQRILMYSNNFLHKRLKTDPQNRTQRLQRTKGQAALGKLVEISELPEQTCCVEKCVRLARSHSLLLKQWRERAISGQLEARKVLAEMLTPSGHGSNCVRFIAMVTGRSITTIARVKNQMWKTGGDREPPQHGLKKYWRDRPKSKTSLLLEEEGELRAGARGRSSGDGGGGGGAGKAGAQGSVMTVAQLIQQQDQLKKLQQQLEEQQQQVRQQQQQVRQQQRLVEQQLVQHQLRQNRQIKQQAALAEAQRKVSNQRRPSSSKSTSSNSAPTLPSTQKMSTNVTVNQSNLQPAPGEKHERYAQPPASTNHQARTTVTHPQTANQQVPTISVEQQQIPVQPQQTLPDGTQHSQQQQHQHSQQPLTATVSGLEGIDAKLLQQNLQQILAELQSQMVTQQFQQQLMNCGIQLGQSSSNQPPSYSSAVAATNQTQVVQSQHKLPKESVQPTQIIIQAIPSLPHNLLLSSNGHGLASSSNLPQYSNTLTSGSASRLKPTESSPILVPITLHHPSNQRTAEEPVNPSDPSVHMQEVVMPLPTQVAEPSLLAPRQQQLPTILQPTIHQHLPNLGPLASHGSESSATRPSGSINIDGLCGSDPQPSPGNIGDLVEVEDAARMVPGGAEESIPSNIPLVGGVSVETLLSPEALQLLNSTGQASLNVSLSSSSRNHKDSTSGTNTI